ncbi:MAG TPA: hypothetical protein VL096_18095, partial [Pirellulaceae bacterium]|nr:hypothetical protein [Pirellulaceae bacterium]
RAIGPTTGMQGGQKGSYALLTFGKPARATNCDCERSMEPSLLQTLFLRNDGEMLGLIERSGGWVQEVAKESAASAKDTNNRRAEQRRDASKLTTALDKAKQQLAKLDAKKDSDEYKQLEARKTKLERQVAQFRKAEAQVAAEAAKRAATPEKVDPKVIAERGPELIRQAYLRTLSRTPSDDEIAKGQAYLAESASVTNGLRDLLWALLNTKEFIVNH